MKFLVNLTSFDQINSMSCENVDFYMEIKRFSRMGKLDTENALALFEAAKNNGYICFLQVDILLTETEFSKAINQSDFNLFNKFDAIRVQDAGVAQWFKDEMPEKKLHLILETGHHNIVAVQTWIDHLGVQIERVVLSNEIPKALLEEYKKMLSVPIEILGAGRLLLFYTPRNLVSAHFVDHDDPETKRVFSGDYVELYGSSEESPHSGFPIVENSHGTFMFLPKDFFILDQYEEILDLGIDCLRVDLSHLDEQSNLYNYLNDVNQQNFKKLKEVYPIKTIKGYFNVNKSDVLFNKLKNKKTLRKDESYCGEVLEVCKKTYIAIKIEGQRSLKLGDVVTYYSPDSKIKVFQVKKLKDSNNREVEEIAKGKIAFLDHLGGVSIKTQVYFGEDPFSLKQ